MATIKVLVPTDFSDNSKAGLKFAMQWSLQQKIELIFIHVFHLIRLPQWTDEDFDRYISNQKSYYANQLNQFSRNIYKSSGINRGKYSCVALYGVSPDISIMDYCREQGDINYICIATRGAGKLDKLFGTHTGNLITKSPVPVIAVPKNYRRRKQISSLLYATDFVNPEPELKRVFDFARPLHASVTMLHLAWPDDVPPDRKATEKKLLGKHKIDFRLKIATTDLIRSLHQDLEAQAGILKPSMIIMFTNQRRNLFQKIFFASKSEQLSFATKVPLLVFKKE
jgi:nucleotide-binding universal stress UspA family protein